MAPEHHELDTVNIPEEQQRLLAVAQKAQARRAGRTIFHGDGMRQTMVALLANEELAEHESPLEAFLYILQGQVVIYGDNRQWTATTGELLPIPPERHSLTAVEDSVITLTVLRDASAFHK